MYFSTGKKQKEKKKKDPNNCPHALRANRAEVRDTEVRVLILRKAAGSMGDCSVLRARPLQGSPQSLVFGETT